MLDRNRLLNLASFRAIAATVSNMTTHELWNADGVHVCCGPQQDTQRSVHFHWHLKNLRNRCSTHCKEESWGQERLWGFIWITAEGSLVPRWVLALLAGSVCNLLDSPPRVEHVSCKTSCRFPCFLIAHCNAHQFGPGGPQQGSAGAFQIF